MSVSFSIRTLRNVCFIQNNYPVGACQFCGCSLHELSVKNIGKDLEVSVEKYKDNYYHSDCAKIVKSIYPEKNNID